MRAFSRTAMVLLLGAGLLLASFIPVRAQIAPVRLMTVAEEQVSTATLAQLQSSYSDERARLEVRLQANAPDQTPGTLTTSVNELAGRAVDVAMGHAAVVSPHGTPVVIGLQGQVGPDGARQLVLYNLTAWIDHGRRLGMNEIETFAILADDKMRGTGDTFTVDGVQYLARWENGSLTFHRP
jgi:hypothetical protein